MGDQESRDPAGTGGEPGAASVDPNVVAPDAGSQDPDSDAGPAVDPIEGDQGPQVQEQDGFSPEATDPANREARVSPPAPERQSGVPSIPENADVDPVPENAGPVTGAAPE